MRFWFLIVEFFNGDKVVTAVAIALLVLTVLSAAVGFFVKSLGIYAALSLLFSCAGGMFFLLHGIAGKRAAFILVAEGSLVGGGYAVLYIALELRRKRARQKEGRAALKRRLQFTLPDRENRYLRDRLHTALNTESDTLFLDKKKVDARLHYVRKMLVKIKEAPLSPIERIDVEEIAGLVALYEKKGRWSSSDVKRMSEVFSRLLKLSAKYEIAV